MHRFHVIMSIILLFHESRPEKMVNHAITPTSGGNSKTNQKKENRKIPVNIKKHNKQESEVKFNTTTMQKDIDNKIKVY